MKWGRKKTPSSSSSSRPSLISQVLPTSWLTKFKHKSVNPGQEHAKAKQKGKWNSVSTSPLPFAAGGGGRFYGGDGDAFWRLSFGDDSTADGEKSRGVLRSFHYDLDSEPEALPSSCQSCRSNATRVNSRKEDTFKFTNKVSEARKMRGLPREIDFLPEMDACIREKVAEIRTPRLRVEKDKKLRKTNQRVLDEQQFRFEEEPCEAERIPRKEASKNISETEPERTIGMIEREDCKLTASYSKTDSPLPSTDARGSLLSETGKETVFAAQKENDGFSAEILSYELQKLKDMKIEELKSMREKQRNSLYINRELQRKKSRKMRAFSPRTASKVEICRIKGLEDIKRGKLKKKKKAREKTVAEFTGLENFAVVKTSFDPQKDFRDSMIEMIEEKSISRPEELEELLACYLTLNADEYHDLIIKVFRQVWFDLNQACFDTELRERTMLL